MRRLTAALVLLALLLTGCVWSRRSVEKVCTEAAEALHAGELDRARAIWEEAQPLLGALLPHEEIDETGLLFERLAARATKICSTVRSCSPGCTIFPRWKRRPCAIYCKACRKTAHSDRPCIAKTPERWYALVRGD